MNNEQQDKAPPALGVAQGSASEVVAKLPDGFYFFKDPDFPGIWGMVERIEGRTWRIGEARPMSDNDWDDAVTFYPALPPNTNHEPAAQPKPDASKRLAL